MSKITFESNTLFKKVLLMVNDPALAAQMGDILDLHFFEVTVVPRGADAMQMLVTKHFDVIVCDLTMPGLPVEVFLNALKRIRPGLTTRLVAITDAATCREVRAGGVVSIWKPVDPQILVQTVEAVVKKLEREQPIRYAVGAV